MSAPRITAIVAAAALSLACWAQDHSPSGSASHEQTSHDPVPHADNHGEAEHGGHGGDHHADQGTLRAQALAVDEAPAWYPYIVGGAAVLFVLAATLGSAAIIAKGPEPVEDDHHDAGHGAHAAHH